MTAPVFFLWPPLATSGDPSVVNVTALAAAGGARLHVRVGDLASQPAQLLLDRTASLPLAQPGCVTAQLQLQPRAPGDVAVLLVRSECGPQAPAENPPVPALAADCP
jgi:hypothetical protein